MTTYEGGSVALRVFPVFEGIQRKIGMEANRWGREAGRDFQRGFDQEVGRGRTELGPDKATATRQGATSGGSYADGFKRRVEAAMRALPPAKLKADATEAERTIRDLRLHLEELSRKTVGVDIDAADAMAQIHRIDEQLDELGRDSADVQVRADTAGARAQLAHIHAQVNDLDRDDVNIRVDADTAGGMASIDTFSGRLVFLATAGAAIAPAIVPAAAAASVALAGIGAAALVGLGGIVALAIGFKGITDAVKALGAVQKSAADDAAKAGARQASAAQAVASAQRQLESAERGLANARANAADAAEDAARRVADAQNAVADATEDAADAIADALRRQEDAEQSLAEAQENTRQAQLSLTRARMDAREALEDLAFSTKSAALAEEDAELGLARARQRLAETLAEGVGGLDLQEAELAVRQAELRLERAADRNKDAQAEAAAAEAAGVDGAQAVLDAQQRLSDARETEIGLARRLRDAEEAVIEARVDGAERIAEAQQRVADAIRAQERQQRQSAMAITGALASVEGAQAAMAAATVASADTGSTAMAKLEESMAALSPAGQEFARFLFNLKPAWDALKRSVESALFPGITAGIEAMLPKLPAIISFITALAGVMGTLAQEAGEALAGPEWEAFFGYLASDGPGILLTLGRAFGDFALGVANLLVAFGPLTDLFITGIGNMAASFAAWSAGLEENRGFQTFLDYVRDSIPQINAFFGSLGAAFVNLVRSMAPFGPVVLDIATKFLDFIATLDPRTISNIVLSVLGIAGAIRAVGLASNILNANPIMLLVGALITAYVHSETFRDIVNAVFLAVGTAATWLWENAIGPAFSAISGFITGTLMPVINDLWLVVIQPVFAAIGEAIRVAWEEVIKPAFEAYKLYLETLGSVAMWLWEKAVKPAFDGIASIIRLAWETVIRPAFDAYKAYVGVLGAVALWLWNEIITPAWAGIRTSIDTAWTLIRPVLAALRDFLVVDVGGTVTWLWQELIRPAFNGIATTIATVWTEGIKPIFEKLRDFIKDDVAPVFQEGVDMIGRIWDGLKALVAAPIRFIIDTVINGGILKAYNLIAGPLPGVDTIDDVDIKGFATGGIYPGYTPGRDIGFISVSGGEAIMRPEWTRAIGADRVHAMNAVARTEGVAGIRRRFLGGYFAGGVIDTVKGGVDWAKEGVSGVVGSVVGAAKDFVVGNLRKAAEAILNPILDRLKDWNGGFIGDLGVGLVHKLVDGVLGFAGKKDEEGGDLEGGAFPRSSGGWPKPIRGVLSSNTAAAIAFVKDMFGISNVGGLGQRSNKSDHPMGKALDAMIPNWQNPSGIALGNQLAAWFVNNPDAFGTKYVIWRDQINSGSGWRSYTHPSGNTTNPTLRHMDHVHASLFDKGGPVRGFPGQTSLHELEEVLTA